MTKEVRTDAELLQAIADAWTIEGISPAHHERCQYWLLRTWPTLAKLVVEVSKRNNNRDE